MKRKRAARGIGLLAIAAFACGGGGAAPEALDTRATLCRSCRMPVSEARLASQIAAPGEESLFFDDLACLTRHLRSDPSVSPTSVVYVADYATGGWVPASAARFRRCPGVSTPMGSQMVAFAALPPEGSGPEGCADVDSTEIVGPFGPVK